MKTLILAGGFGTRLRSVVSNLPKPLAPIGDKCFLDYLLLNFKKQGLREFIFCLHYMPDKFVGLYKDGGKLGVSIDYSIEKSPAGTAGAIGMLRSRLQDTFCVMNADTYLEIDMKEMLTKHKEANAFITIAAANVADISRYGCLEVDKHGFVKRFLEKDESVSRSGLINAGLYLIEPQIFDYIRENEFVSLEKEVFPKLLVEGKRIAVYDKVKNFFDIGVPEDYYNFFNWIARL